MSLNRWPTSLRLLCWTLGLVVLWQSLEFAFSSVEAQHLQRMGLALWVGPVLGGVEGLAALLFLIPKIHRIGGWLLLVTFAIAAAIHILHKQFEIGSLLVYSAVVVTCMSRNSRLEHGAAS